MTTVVKGNKREIPGDMPIAVWHDRITEAVERPDLADLPFYHPDMEFLSPEELRQLRAKALIWRQEVGTFPTELSWWWEIRVARRRGDIPHTRERASATIDEQGVLHCGFCRARWSANSDGSPHSMRCKLCDRLWLVIADERGVSV